MHYKNNFLKKKNFILLFFGKLVSQFGDGLFDITIPWYILNISNSPFLMSSYLVVGKCSFCLSTLLFNYKMDCWNKKIILCVTDFARGVSLLGLFFILQSTSQNQIVYMFVCTVVLNSCAALFNPTSLSIIPSIIEKQFLLKANSIFSMLDNTVALVGLAIGGVIFQFLGITFILCISGFFYLFSAISEVFIQIPSFNSAKKMNVGMAAAISYILKNHKIFFVILFTLLWNFIFAMLFYIYIPFIFNQTFASNISELTFVRIATTIGLFVGAAYSSKLKDVTNIYLFTRKIIYLQLPIFISFPVILHLFNAEFIGSVFLSVSYAIILFFLGVTAILVTVKIRVILQNDTDFNYIGRVNSIHSLCSMAAISLSLLIGGVIVENTTISIALISVAFLFIALCVSIKFWSKTS